MSIERLTESGEIEIYPGDEEPEYIAFWLGHPLLGHKNKDDVWRCLKCEGETQYTSKEYEGPTHCSCCGIKFSVVLTKQIVRLRMPSEESTRDLINRLVDEVLQEYEEL